MKSTSAQQILSYRFTIHQEIYYKISLKIPHHPTKQTLEYNCQYQKEMLLVKQKEGIP